MVSPVVTGQWLARFRWAVVAGAAATLLVGRVALDLQFPVAIVAAALGLQAVSNLWLLARLGRESETPQPALGAIVLFDVLLLTLLMLVTGGPSNPFTISYLVYITLAAVTLNARWTWTVALASIGGYGLLFVTPLRAPFDAHAAHAAMQPELGHQVGMWVAFLVAALLTASFVTRIRLALEARERALEDARRHAAQQEKLASLTTLAAGAAHELATPLGTIAVAARELDRLGSVAGVPAEALEDARLIRTQVDRCREILDQMSGRADESVAQHPQSLAAHAIVSAALATFQEGDRARVQLDVAEPVPPVRVPLEAASRALRTLVKNAIEASPDGTPVHVAIAADATQVRFEVVDEGTGMRPEVLERAGEPFFTTKAAGAGYGLGLFLVRAFVERWGGGFDLTSRQGHGTRATLALPAFRGAVDR
jgi:two-component system sensor histidine kinase RegB